GLDRDDPAVRKRIAEKMAFILAQEVVVAPPSEAELRAWFERRRDSWARPARIDFTHVYVAAEGAAGERRAAALLAQLEAGAAPEMLGDTFSGGQRYRGRKLADLAQSFGADFARELDRQPIGGWRLRRSRHGLHLVRLDRVEPARAADFAGARLDVEKEWLDARRAEELAARVRALRDRYQVVDR
ncbi:MAG TPA: peptidylprolyl isomerase, partial [Kofleriaceae bacterium]|nr:peptidylprolyl isomerase [Kofleriaceae bacterium]